MLQNRLKFLFFIFSMIFISSCGDDVVGVWEPMKWDYKNVSEGIKIIKPSGKEKDHAKYAAEIQVSKSGHIDIVCKNYKALWFEEIPEINSDGDYFTHYINDYCDMQIEGNTIHCEFTNIEGDISREYQVVVSAGDIFFRFHIDIN